MKNNIKYSLIIIFIFLKINYINSSGQEITQNVSEQSSTEIKENEKTENGSDLSSTEIKDDENTENGSDQSSQEIKDVLGQDDSISLQNKDDNNDNNSLNNENSPNSSNNDLNKKRCSQTKPLKGIIDDCVKGNKMEGETCCYLELKYSYNSYYGCIPIDKENLNIIKNKIEELKKERKADSAKIKCKSSFIQIQMLLILLICLNLIF